MQRPCAAAHAKPEPDRCRLCWLFLNNPRFTRLWDGKTLTCIHLGEMTGKRECASCNSKIQVGVYRCGKHNECTQTVQIAGLGCCHICPDKEYKDG